MEWLIFLAVLAGVWIFGKDKILQALKEQPKSKPAPPGTQLTVTVEAKPLPPFTPSRNTDAAGNPLVDVGALRAGGEGEWVLNPKAPLQLTLVGASKAIAQEVRATLALSQLSAHRAPELALLIARHNLRFKEVEQFLGVLRPRLEAAMAHLKARHPEWATASERDRADLVLQFEQQIEGTMGVDVGNANLIELLKGPQASFDVDDAVLSQFGPNLDLYPFYLTQLARATQVVVVKADDWSRSSWERLAQMGKARRGKDIPKADILEALKLKELNELLQGVLEKPAGRKAKAIEAALVLPDLDARLERQVAFRELFCAIPPQGVALDELKASFGYATQLALLVQQTYVTGVSTLETLKDRKAEPDVYDAWEVVNWSTPLPECAKAFCQKSARKPSQLPPYHVGCTCRLENSFL